MISLFILAASIAFLHWIFESSIAPSMRLSLRFRGFRIRDRLRRLEIENAVGVTAEGFNILHNNINSHLGHQTRFTLLSLIEFIHSLKTDEDLRKLSERRIATLDACKCEEFQEIRKEFARIVRGTILVNSGALFIYMVPVAMCIYYLSEIRKGVRNLIVLPESATQKFAPPVYSY